MSRRDARGAPPEPLHPDESRHLGQVLSRVSSELRAALQSLPEHREGASALARSLSIDRASAHRLLALAARRSPTLDALQQAPGTEAMEQFAEALAKSRPANVDLPSLRHAIAQLRLAVQELGPGSKSRLMRRIAATIPSDDSGASPQIDGVRARREQELRQQLFSTTSELLGRHTQTRIDMMICRLNPDQPKLMDYAQVRGVIGHRSRPPAQPLSVELLGHVTPDPTGQKPLPLLTLDGKPLDADGDPADTSILREFSTEPLPIVTSRGGAERVRNVVDPNFTSQGKSVDVVVAFHRLRACQHPAFDAVPSLEVGALIREPARNLILDVWLHREMNRGAVPALELYLWSPTIETSLVDHWLDRLTASQLLQVLGRGLERSADPAYARHAELTRHAFDKLGWNPDDYVGYRAHVDYPMFGGAYFAVFDYST